MYTLFKTECKTQIKSLFIWTAVVGGMGLVCILLYQSMEDSMTGMAENFASMGAFSEAFGMNTLSIATLRGYFAAEIGTIHALGGSMFAATLASVILSKEEENHTGEFTYTLPVSRGKTVIVKYASVLCMLAVFTVLCAFFYQTGFWALGEKGVMKDFVSFMAFQFMMNTEVAAICFLISAVSRKNRLGLGISIPVILYVYDLMARVVPALEDAKFLSPFAYANATEIFSHAEKSAPALLVGAVVIVGLTGASGVFYTRRDLAS